MNATKAILSFSAVFLLGLLAIEFVFKSPIANAVPKSQVQLDVLLNGKPGFLGEIVLDGGSNTNATTWQPFTITGGSVIKVECEAAARVGLQAACSSVYQLADAGADSNFCEAIAIQPAQKLYVVPDGVTTLAAKGTPGTTCAVWQMQ